MKKYVAETGLDRRSSRKQLVCDGVAHTADAEFITGFALFEEGQHTHTALGGGTTLIEP